MKEFEYSRVCNGIRIDKCLVDRTKIIIPIEIEGELVTTIGARAFDNCRNLQTLMLSSSITKIDRSAFAKCINLLKVTLINVSTGGGLNISLGRDGALKLSGIDEEFGENFHYSRAADGNIQINRYIGEQSEVEIPASIDGLPVTCICMYAFQFCMSLTRVVVPNTVTSIGRYAFADCPRLQTVKLSNAMTYIGNHTFSRCTNLTRVDISNSVTYIGEWAFENCIRPENIVIPNSVTMIGFGAFDGCRNLTRVVVENPNLQLDKQSVFFNCNPQLQIIRQ